MGLKIIESSRIKRNESLAINNGNWIDHSLIYNRIMDHNYDFHHGVQYSL